MSYVTSIDPLASWIHMSTCIIESKHSQGWLTVTQLVGLAVALKPCTLTTYRLEIRRKTRSATQPRTCRTRTPIRHHLHSSRSAGTFSLPACRILISITHTPILLTLMILRVGSDLVRSLDTGRNHSKHIMRSHLLTCSQCTRRRIRANVEHQS